MKNNQKGFVLAETLVVAVFVMTIFTIIYANFYPIMGRYQEREYFDDVDSTYNTYWLKRFFQDEDIINATAWSVVTQHITKLGGYEFTCKKMTECPMIAETDYKKLMVGFFGATDCRHVYITKYNIESSKHINGENSSTVMQFRGKKTTGTANYVERFSIQSNVDAVNAWTEQLTLPAGVDNTLKKYHVTKIPERTKRYIDYLPAYKFPSKRGAKYRIIAEYARDEDGADDKATKTKIYTYSTIELKRG